MKALTWLLSCWLINIRARISLIVIQQKEKEIKDMELSWEEAGKASEEPLPLKYTCWPPVSSTCDLHWPSELSYMCVVSLLTVWITAILLTLFVLVEWELSCKDEILFTFVIEWLWRERKHGANRYICHGHADKTTALQKVGRQEVQVLWWTVSSYSNVKMFCFSLFLYY